MDNFEFFSRNDKAAASSSNVSPSDDILIPSEYLDTCRRKTYYEPEKKLMLALLNDAIYCFQHYLGARTRARKRLFAAAEQWIVKSGAEWLYSFDSVCEHLGIDANYLRSGLEYYKECRRDQSARLKKSHWNQVSRRLTATA